MIFYTKVLVMVSLALIKPHTKVDLVFKSVEPTFKQTQIGKTFDINNFEIIKKKFPIVFTNYYTNDSLGSVDMTSSGLSSKHFQKNSKGWYTYQGKVVLAAATDRCLNATTGGCGKYKSIPKGIEVHSLYDKVLFEVDGKEYEGIILDSCGACMQLHSSDGYVQRYDIFIAGSKYRFNKLKGHKIKKEAVDVNLHT